ncbi:unnamed protein product [Effrenium voratum]|uniref:RRM domain-containing protein n=1 Tax=Effrenium voratum TaxID=2562239 RepID=A0AA36JJS7_9DINO|nr:unnamed protein product [Effrenium voratum]
MPSEKELLALVESTKGSRKKRKAGQELPPELQDAEIIGGSSDVELSDSTEDEDEAPSKAKGKKRKERKVEEEEPEVKEPKAKAEPERSSGRRDGQIFLSQLPFSVDADVLKKDFSKFGEISRFFFHQDEEGKPRGTACIFYKDPDVPDKVILLDGIEYKGRNIKVKRRQRRPGGRQARKAREKWEKWEKWETQEDTEWQTPRAKKAEESFTTWEFQYAKNEQDNAPHYRVSEKGSTDILSASDGMRRGVPNFDKINEVCGSHTKKCAGATWRHYLEMVAQRSGSPSRRVRTIRTLDRGAVLLTHGAENSGVVHILRKGALAYCFPPERKEEPANRWHRCAVASMNPSQVVTTLGELVGAYHALLGEKEPATVRVESASCEVYRIPWVELKRVLTKRVLTELREKLLRCHDLRSGIAATHTPRDLLKVTASSSVKGAMPTREQQAVKDALSEAFDAVCAYAEGCGEGLSAATEKVKHKQSSSLLSATSTASPEERRKAFEQSVAKAVASLEEATKNAGLWESLSTGEAPHDAEPRSQPPPVTSTAHVRAQFLQVLKEDGGIGMAKFVTEAVLDPVKGNLNAWIQKYMDSERLRKHSDLQTLQLILRRQQKSGTKANDKAGSRLEKSAGADQRPGKRRSQAS